MKTVLLTGASGGFGIEIALALLKHNYFVILHYYQSLKPVLKIHQMFANQTLVVKADLRKEEDVIKIYQFLKEKHISIDVLINNAGVDFVSELAQKKKETFLPVFEVNTLGPFFLMKRFISEIENRKGTILNISSDNTIDQYDMVSLEYDVSKSGLNQLTKTFAKTYPNAKINALCFGWLDTKMNQIPEENKKDIPFVSFEKATNKVLEWIETDQTGKIEVVR